MTAKSDIAYVIQSTEGDRIVKVGFSTNPQVRLTNIRHSVPFGVELVAMLTDGKATERRLKEMLSPWQRKGEWFDPRPELNAFLSAARARNEVVTAIEVDQAYSDAFIRPFVLEYLGGRAPLLNNYGDLVARFLHEGLSAIKGRERDLSAAITHKIPANVLAGFVPLTTEAPTPQIVIPDLQREAA